MKIFFTLFLFCICNFIFSQIDLPQASPFAVCLQKIGLAEVKIEYSRPSLRNRKMIGSEIIPFGEVWRTGANKIPNIHFSKDVKLSGYDVPAGVYGLITIPSKKDWTIILTKNANQWGTYSYNKEEDFLRFNAKHIKTAEKEEHFTIGITDFNETKAFIFLRWENSLVKFEISNDPHNEIMKEIEQKINLPEVSNDTYYDAANYFYNKGLDINKALNWANKLLEKDKQYWTYYLRGKIAAKAGKCDIALSDALIGIELAKKENDLSYVKNHQTLIEQCKKK